MSQETVYFLCDGWDDALSADRAQRAALLLTDYAAHLDADQTVTPTALLLVHGHWISLTHHTPAHPVGNDRWASLIATVTSDVLRRFQRRVAGAGTAWPEDTTMATLVPAMAAILSTLYANLAADPALIDDLVAYSRHRLAAGLEALVSAVITPFARELTTPYDHIAFDIRDQPSAPIAAHTGILIARVANT